LALFTFGAKSKNMILKDKSKRIPAIVIEFVNLIVSMAGFVPKHASLLRVLTFGASLVFSFYLTANYAGHSTLGIIYFIAGEIFYLGFIFLVLSKNGLRHWFIKYWKSEQEGYLAFEAILGIAFFHNAASLSFLASATPGHLFPFISREILLIIVILMTAAGFIIKIWSARIVSIDIYYWKDMFLGRKICEFVVTGPYKFLSNPMYGIGQLSAYSLAVWYQSEIGLAAAFINQCLVFTFYYTVEKKFINRVYLKK
jgi:protein-S-isoprenylcysteine O-methyltransferase Ste14